MRLLIPFDGSAAAAHAVAHALHLAEHSADSLLIVLNVQNVQTLGLSDILPREEIAALGSEASEELLAKPVYQCGVAGVRCAARAEYGPVAETIVRVAPETKADQIVMGTRGLGRLQGLPGAPTGRLNQTRKRENALGSACPNSHRRPVQKVQYPRV